MGRTERLVALVLVLLAGASVARATEPEASERAEARGETVPPPPPQAGGSAEPREERDGGAPSVDLFPEDALGSAVGWELPPEPSPSTVEEESEADLDRWIDDRVRQDQIGAGMVDGWYYAMRQSMRSAFHPDPNAVIDDLRRSMSPVEWAAAELGRHAAPRQRTMDPGGVAPQTIFSRSREDEHVQDTFDQASPLYAGITWHRVELRVVQTRAGGIAAVRVIRSSGSATLDRAAVEAVRSGVVSIPPPPPEVIGERDAITSEWGFEMGDIASRITGVSGMEGPDGTGMQGGLLGRGLIRTSVSLLRVVDAAHPTVDERRAARRAREPR